jgi:tripartite-type tricarboxylate transporter receptor subunit TctC
MFIGPIEVVEHIKTGRLRALAVSTTKRLDVLSDLPMVADFVPGYESSSWFGIGTPRSTPAEIIGKLNSDINNALADPKIKARLSDLGTTVLGGSPDEFGKLIADETEKWAKVVRAANIKPD